MARFQGLRVDETEAWGRDYQRESVEEVYRHDSQWTGWDDVVRWLDQGAEADEQLNPGETAAMKEDFQKLAEQNQPYTSDPGKAFELAHGNRPVSKTAFKSGRGTGGSQV